MVTIGNSFSASGSQSLAAIKPPIVKSTKDSDDDRPVLIKGTPPGIPLPVKPLLIDDYA
jgi:hypothetical protein